jgi:DNA anti-recombination protein RmuC
MISRRLEIVTEENQRQLDQIRETVKKKLQKTLEDRIGKSFQLVSERLEQVYRGLGEMQSIAAGVGDLKKVLSNVKTRGILGEIQLGAILEQILSPEQYEMNIATKKNSTNVVEFAIKLPGDENGAWHSSELWYFFGTLKNGWRPFTDHDYKISEAMTTALCNFAKTGNPNGEGLPTWEPTLTAKDQIMIWGEKEPYMGKPSKLKQWITMFTNKAVGE